MKTIPLAALAVSAAFSASAQIIELEEITASASLEEVATSRSGASVVILGQDDLRELGDMRLTDLLQRLGGITVRAQGPAGTQTGVVIRGASQNYIAVYVDGIEVSDPSGPQVAYDFGALTAAGIERIEILKGSQSALYGSRAVGGVVSITTRRAAEVGRESSVDLEAGSYGTLRGAMSTAARSEAGELALTLSHASTDGFSAADENAGNTEADGFSVTRLGFYGHRDLENGVRIGASGLHETSEAEFDEFGPVDGVTPNEVTDNRSWGLRGFAHWSTGSVDHAVEASLFDITRESRGDFGPSTFDGERARAAYQGGVSLGGNRLAFGADLTREEASDSFGFAGANTVAGIFGEFAWATNAALDVTTALRVDRHSEFGTHTTGRIAAAYRPAADLTFRAALGTGFRAPSGYELFSAFGDPTLRPEASLSADLGVEKRLSGGGVIEATAFYLKVDDLIDFDFAAVACGSGFGCYAQVPGRSERSGLELAGRFPVGDKVELSAAYTYTDSATNASSAWARVPRHAVSVTATAEIAPGLKGVLTVQHAADRQAGLADYTVAHAALSYRVSDTTEAYLRIENIADAEYQLVPGYGTSDRAYYVGIRRSF